MTGVKKIPAWLWFTLIRLAAFVIPLLILLALGFQDWIAALIAAIIGFCVSYIFFAKSRSAVSAQIYEARKNKKTHDQREAEAEDAEIETSLNKKP